MKTKTLEDLEQLLDLRFRKKQVGYAKIVAQESRLREQIQRLDLQARDAEQSQDHQLQAIGADVIWKSWLERTKRSLNMELAQVMVQKEALKNGVRREYGKLLVGTELLSDQRSEQQTALQKQVLADAIDGHVNSAVLRKSSRKTE